MLRGVGKGILHPIWLGNPESWTRRWLSSNSTVRGGGPGGHASGGDDIQDGVVAVMSHGLVGHAGTTWALTTLTDLSWYMNTSSCSESTYGQLTPVGGWWFVPHDLQLYFLFVIKREVRVCLDQVPVPEWWSELAPRGELSVGISDRGCQEITSESGSGYPRRRGNRNTVQWRWLTLHNYIVSYTQKLYTITFNELFLAPLCHLAAELFKCRLVRRRRRRRQL